MLTAEAARRGSGGHRGRELTIVAGVALVAGGLLAGMPLLLVGDRRVRRGVHARVVVEP